MTVTMTWLWHEMANTIWYGLWCRTVTSISIYIWWMAITLQQDKAWTSLCTWSWQWLWLWLWLYLLPCLSCDQYGMTCYVMTQCDIQQWDEMEPHAISQSYHDHSLSCHTISFHSVSLHVTSHRITTGCATSHHSTPYHVTSHQVTHDPNVMRDAMLVQHNIVLHVVMS